MDNILFEIELDQDIYEEFIKFREQYKAKTSRNFTSDSKNIILNSDDKDLIYDNKPTDDDKDENKETNYYYNDKDTNISDNETNISEILKDLDFKFKPPNPRTIIKIYPKIQLPIFIYKVYKGQTFRAIVYFCDSVFTPEKRRYRLFIRLIELPSSHEKLLNAIFDYPSCPFGKLQTNSETGWSGWKHEFNHKPICIYRTSDQGQGFENPPGTTACHRDYLMNLCTSNKEPKYLTNRETVENMKKTMTPEQLFEFLESNLDKRVVARINDDIIIPGCKRNTNARQANNKGSNKGNSSKRVKG